MPAYYILQAYIITFYQTNNTLVPKPVSTVNSVDAKTLTDQIWEPVSKYLPSFNTLYTLRTLHEG